jgi:hypothetical protein
MAILAIYSNQVTLTAGTAGSAYQMPDGEIIDIAFSTDADGVVQFSLDDPNTVSAGTATFYAGKSGSPINKAVTAWRGYRNTGTVVCTVTVKVRE